MNRRACKLHFEVAPLKIVRASRQYLFDDQGSEYLDCISNVSHVGHCHPHVVLAGQEQMAQLTTCAGFLDDKMVEYAKRIIETLPDQLCVCYFLNSGSEANDMALRLAKSYTKNDHFIVVENAYHGNIATTLDVSPLKWKKMGTVKKDWVHVVDCPDIYRGKYKEDSENPGALYAADVKKIIKNIQKKHDKGGIAAFISEPVMTAPGVIIPPKKYLQYVYRYVREAGGLCIADEVQVGLGRSGENFWSFQNFDVVPDIITVGKPLGNGYPMALVVTKKEIADSVMEFNSTFGGNPVACAVGMAVLDVIKNEKLMSSAKSVGRCLIDGFKAIAQKHDNIGDVRGMGMCVGVDIVKEKGSRKPAKEVAEILAYKLKEQKIIVANEGPEKNVMLILPPMCFTCDNARCVVQAFDTALTEIELGSSSDGVGVKDEQRISVPLNILTAPPGLLDEDSSDEDGPAAKQAKYEEMD
ncbi:hypothetical protein FSP39_006659 [Pinctada imbricata]|uniref:Uncharacterized protein n=1 Tax=Pinctada imbricata TaxID=66713 RepID=A0AA89BW92_PINIB|nr:hypothetical protein FSP39_006659 [Pinctada imbricata]